MRSSVLLEPDEQKTIADRAYRHLKNDIIDGKLAQGSKIVEEDLASEYGVSRGPVREAIRRLEGQKLVVRIPHAGARVVTLTRKMMADIYAVRESLEGMSVRLAAQRMSEEKIDALFRLLAQHEAAIAAVDGKTYLQHEGNLDFHYRIAEASGNQLLTDYLYRDLYQLIRMCRHQSAQLPERPARALAEHRQIVEAIAARDGELAELLMRRHISNSWKIVETLLPEDVHV